MSGPTRRVALKVVGATLGAGAFAYAGRPVAQWAASVDIDDLLRRQLTAGPTVLARILKPTGILVLTRIAGLLLAAIAVQLIADGVFGFIAANGS